MPNYEDLITATPAVSKTGLFIRQSTINQWLQPIQQYSTENLQGYRWQSDSLQLPHLHRSPFFEILMITPFFQPDGIIPVTHISLNNTVLYLHYFLSLNVKNLYSILSKVNHSTVIKSKSGSLYFILGNFVEHSVQYHKFPCIQFQLC